MSYLSGGVVHQRQLPAVQQHGARGAGGGARQRAPRHPLRVQVAQAQARPHHAHGTRARLKSIHCLSDRWFLLVAPTLDQWPYGPMTQASFRATCPEGGLGPIEPVRGVVKQLYHVSSNCVRSWIVGSVNFEKSICTRTGFEVRVTDIFRVLNYSSTCYSYLGYLSKWTSSDVLKYTLAVISDRICS